MPNRISLNRPFVGEIIYFKLTLGLGDYSRKYSTKKPKFDFHKYTSFQENLFAISKSNQNELAVNLLTNVECVMACETYTSAYKKTFQRENQLLNVFKTLSLTGINSIVCG